MKNLFDISGKVAVVQYEGKLAESGRVFDSTKGKGSFTSTRVLVVPSAVNTLTKAVCINYSRASLTYL